MDATAKRVTALFLGMVALFPGGLRAQSADSDPGASRPVSAAEIDRLRQTIYDETQSNVEAIFGYHAESGDLNNRLNFYRYGARANVKLQSGALLYLSGTWTPYWTIDRIVEASGANLTFGAKPYLAEGVVTQFEVGATRFSTGGSTINALGSLGFSWADVAVNITGSRTNVEESLLSAAGVRPVSGPFAGRTVGQVMDNRAVIDGTYRFLPQADVFANGGFGYRKGAEVDSNPFWLGGGGVGYNVISAPADESISLLRASYELNYISFQDDRLGFGGASFADSRGRSIPVSRIGSDGISPVPGSGRPGIGGYFSPEKFFTHVIRGELRGQPNSRLEYQISGFVGSQYITGTSRRQAAGFSGMLAVRLSDRYSLPITVTGDNFGPFTQESVFARLVVRF
jgi:hypothetical protein